MNTQKFRHACEGEHLEIPACAGMTANRSETLSTLNSLDPWFLFADWYESAQKNEVTKPNAMGLATITPDGKPRLRMVLMQKLDPEEGWFSFTTSMESKKARDMLHNPNVSLCFHWKSTRRQVRINGKAEPFSPTEADAYFAEINMGCKITGWATQKSKPLSSRAELMQRVVDFTEKYGEETKIPRPPYWGGFKIVAEMIEFWEERPNRLHERLAFNRNPKGVWEKTLLYP